MIQNNALNFQSIFHEIVRSSVPQTATDRLNLGYVVER